MLLSLGVAYAIPFELVLISYAFLGPAHYLTEISWLHDRSYFTGNKWLWIPMGLVSLFIVWLGWDKQGEILPVFIAFCVALAFSIGMALAQSWPVRVAIVGAAIAALFACHKLFSGFGLALAILIPTVIHIYVFTGLFILSGALKGRAVWGYISFAVFLACGAFFFFVTPSINMISSDFVDRNLGYFDGLVDYIVYAVSLDGRVNGHSVVAFLSFAYTYHYLNWFSKTEIIKWHIIPRKRLVAMVALYLVSITVYLVDFQTGFLVLAFLSLTHVVLEFPLNAVSVRMIGQSLRGMVPVKAR